MSIFCTRCGAIKRESRMHRRWCDVCADKAAAYQRANSKPYASMSEEKRRKAVARAYANSCQRRGKFARQPCQVCYLPAEKHHHDYDKPLEFIWLCHEHHLLLHTFTDALAA